MAFQFNKKNLLKKSRPPHLREDWNLPACETALIHTRLSILHGTEDNGTDKKYMATLYNAAKLSSDFKSAQKLIDLIWKKTVEDKLADLVISHGQKPIIAFPHPGFDDDDNIDYDAGTRTSSKNALPFAHAARLTIALDGIQNTSIKQASRVGRTKLKRFPRFLYQPSFTGEVDKDRPYILVDDTLSLGGTLAVMRSYIVRNGGRVIAVSALAHSQGKDILFAQTQNTYDSLMNLYGSELVDLWKGEIGHAPTQLTNAEADFLCDWADTQNTAGNQIALLQSLRARLNRARTTCE